MNDARLTKKEVILLAEFRRGMDERNTGWLHEMTVRTGLPSASISGLIGSMVKKGIILCDLEKEPGRPDVYWITVRDNWRTD